MLGMLTAAVMAFATVAACGGGTQETDTTEPSTGAGAATDAFPITIAHSFGETTIPAEPQRVVTVGQTDQDAVLALGVAPVATTEWYGEQPGALFPWAREKLGDRALPTVLQVKGEGSSCNEISYFLEAASKPLTREDAG